MALHSREVVRKITAHIVPRGDLMQEHIHVMPNGVIIDTTYAARTEEEREKVDIAVAEACWAIVDELRARGEEV